MSTTPNSLRTLAEKKTDGVSKSTIFRVDPRLLKAEKGFNLREDNDELTQHIEHLYQAMKAGAFIPPVDVSVEDDGKIVIRDGHCRTKAAVRLRKEMPEYTLECRQLRGNDADAILHMLGTGGGAKPLTPLEQGKGYLHLIKMGLKPAEIAAKLGVSRPTVDNGVVLAEAPVEVQKMIASGEVSSTAAAGAIKQGKEGVKALVKAVKDERATPTKKKNGKKGKVTAKKLKGTKAEKRVKKKVKKDTAQKELDLGDSITITIKRSDAEKAVKFIKGVDFVDDYLNLVCNAIEVALL